jgi:putative glycosyltransferase (TIGR04372 family)
VQPTVIFHLKQLFNEGWPALRRKSNKLPYVLFPVLVFFPLLIIMLREKFFIRVVSISSDPIGHLSIETELNYRTFKNSVEVFKKRFPNSKKKFFILFFRSGRICNYTLYRLLKRQFIFVHPSIGKVCVVVLRFLNFYSNAPYLFIRNRDLKDTMPSLENPIKFSTQEYAFVKKNGTFAQFNVNKPYICILNRESTYHDQFFSGIDSHNSYRNVDINDFVPLIDFFNRRGIQVVRMGSNMKQDIHYQNSLFFDYSKSRYRSDFYDIFLPAHCDFFVSVSTGLDMVAWQFRRPVYYCNVAPLSHVQIQTRTIFTPKLLVSNHQNVHIKSDSVEFNQARFLLRTEFLNELSLHYTSNTSDEILNLAEEIFTFHYGNFHLTKSQLNLQEKFWVNFPYNSNLHFRNYHKAIISPYFLNKHADLFT